MKFLKNNQRDDFIMRTQIVSKRLKNGITLLTTEILTDSPRNPFESYPYVSRRLGAPPTCKQTSAERGV